jgi:phospholipid/cholesterol/gamma-HCH transport system substrate-binding protein
VRSLKIEVAVGVFAVVVMGILTAMTFRVGDLSFGTKEGYVLYATFRNIAGLENNTRVKIAGVDAGVVESIQLLDGHARVTLRMRPEIVVYSDAEAFIKATGLLGDKFVELTTGSAAPSLADGDSIGTAHEMADIDELVRRLTAISGDLGGFAAELNKEDFKQALQDTMQNLQSITTDLKTTMTTNRDKIDVIIERIRSISVALDETINENRAPFTNTISNFEAITADIRKDAPELMADLREAASELREMLVNARPQLESVAARADLAMANIASIANKIDGGRGTIGRLVNDEQLYDQVTRAAGGISNTLSAIDRFRTFIEFRGDYLADYSDTKGYFNITLQPRPDRYYMLGLVTNPIGKVSTTIIDINGAKVVEERVEDTMEFTALFGRRFHNTGLRIGLMENTFGMGADQYFMKDRFRLFVDAWDFSNDEYLSEDPHMKVGADIYATRNIFLTGGYDNFLNDNRHGMFVGGGVRFEDEDFKYLFGSVAGAFPTK